MHGNCTAPDYCHCSPGWAGALCQTALCPAGCLEGTCNTPGVCTCRKGWVGVDCGTPVCEPPCSQHGKCVAPDTCECVAGFTGKDCSIGNSKCCRSKECYITDANQCQECCSIPPGQPGACCYGLKPSECDRSYDCRSCDCNPWCVPLCKAIQFCLAALSLSLSLSLARTRNSRKHASGRASRTPRPPPPPPSSHTQLHERQLLHQIPGTRSGLRPVLPSEPQGRPLRGLCDGILGPRLPAVPARRGGQRVRRPRNLRRIRLDRRNGRVRVLPRLHRCGVRSVRPGILEPALPDDDPRVAVLDARQLRLRRVRLRPRVGRGRLLGVRPRL
jgi:hypothetical protein